MTMKTEMEVWALKSIIGMLITKLDEKGVISKSEFAKQLRDEADHAERAPSQTREIQRHDLTLFRDVSDLLATTPPPRWAPTVIDSGKSDDQEK